MNDVLLDAALQHHEAGRRVLPVKANKKPHCERWGQWIEKPPQEQTEGEVYQLFGNGAHGLAVIQYPGSPNVTVDFDGEHADEAWNKTGITLTRTAKTRTPRNGWHWIYRTPDDTSLLDRVKRRVRLAVADCYCKDAEGSSKPCGVDLLLNGYSIEPPTPGYREDPEHPLESAAEIQREVLELALRQQEEEKTGARPTGDADGKVRRGVQHDTAISLVGTMRRRRMSLEAIRAALKADSDARFEPPLTANEIDYFVGEAAKWNPGEENFHLTELGNAQRLVRLHGEDLHFCSERGWYTWDGKRWKHDSSGEIKRQAKDTVRSIYLEAAHCTDGKLRDALGEHARRSEAKARIDAMIGLAESEPGIPVSHEELDRDPWLLNVANGTIDLRTVH